jgi:V/A-type H+-transporting ATPase subunit E
MNGAEKIKDRILADARALSHKILEDAKLEAQSILASAEKEAFQKVTVMTEQAREEAVLIKQRFAAATGMEDRKKLLKIRQDSVNEAFQAALQRLADLPKDQYGAFLEKILLNTVKDENCEIVFNQRDKERLGDAFVKKANEKLAGQGMKTRLTLAKDALSAAGGFILRYEDMEVNCTLEVLINMARPELESEVAAILLDE